VTDGSTRATGRVLGVDLGTRRIGLALSDPLRITAGPLAVIERSGDRAADHGAILDSAREHEATRIVVGLPLSLATGRPGPAARSVLDEVAELARRAERIEPPLAVETYDERLSTVSAEAALSAGGVKASARRGVVDKVAAAVILQSWLDGQRRR
jgi:putative pre-16S rRNA nuclease